MMIQSKEDREPECDSFPADVDDAAPRGPADLRPTGEVAPSGGACDPVLAPMSAAESDRLAALEAVVGQHVAGFFEAAKALASIRDEKLYRSAHPNFESYLRERWGISRSHAYRLIEASRVAEELDAEGLSPIGDSDGAGTSPLLNEAQVRELARAPEGRRRAVLRAAVDAAPKDPAGKPVLTAGRLRRTVEASAAAPDAGSSATDDHGPAPEHDLSRLGDKPATSAPSFADFNAGVEEVRGMLRQVYARFAEVTGYTGDKGGRQFTNPWAQCYSPDGTLGAIRRLSLSLKLGMPAVLWERAPGFRTVGQVTATDRWKKS